MTGTPPEPFALPHSDVASPAAEDIVQEAFISIWQSRATYSPAGGRVGAWTMGIIGNRSIDAVRRHRAKKRERPA